MFAHNFLPHKVLINLEKLGVKQLNRLQERCLKSILNPPHIMKQIEQGTPLNLGSNQFSIITGISGTGKTIGFLSPLIALTAISTRLIVDKNHHLGEDELLNIICRDRPKFLIMCPSRDLCLQSAKVLSQMTRNFNICDFLENDSILTEEPCCFIHLSGGRSKFQNKNDKLRQIHSKFDIPIKTNFLFSTPGFLSSQLWFSLERMNEHFTRGRYKLPRLGSNEIVRDIDGVAEGSIEGIADGNIEGIAEENIDRLTIGNVERIANKNIADFSTFENTDSNEQLITNDRSSKSTDYIHPDRSGYLETANPKNTSLVENTTSDLDLLDGFLNDVITDVGIGEDPPINTSFEQPIEVNIKPLRNLTPISRRLYSVTNFELYTDPDEVFISLTEYMRNNLSAIVYDEASVLSGGFSMSEFHEIHLFIKKLFSCKNSTLTQIIVGSAIDYSALSIYLGNKRGFYNIDSGSTWRRLLVGDLSNVEKINNLQIFRGDIQDYRRRGWKDLNYDKFEKKNENFIELSATELLLHKDNIKEKPLSLDSATSTFITSTSTTPNTSINTSSNTNPNTSTDTRTTPSTSINTSTNTTPNTSTDTRTTPNTTNSLMTDELSKYLKVQNIKDIVSKSILDPPTSNPLTLSHPLSHLWEEGADFKNPLDVKDLHKVFLGQNSLTKNDISLPSVKAKEFDYLFHDSYVDFNSLNIHSHYFYSIDKPQQFFSVFAGMLISYCQRAMAEDNNSQRPPRICQVYFPTTKILNFFYKFTQNLSYFQKEKQNISIYQNHSQLTDQERFHFLLNTRKDLKDEDSRIGRQTRVYIMFCCSSFGMENIETDLILSVFPPPSLTDYTYRIGRLNSLYNSPVSIVLGTNLDFENITWISSLFQRNIKRIKTNDFFKKINIEDLQVLNSINDNNTISKLELKKQRRRLKKAQNQHKENFDPSKFIKEVKPINPIKPWFTFRENLVSYINFYNSLVGYYFRDVKLRYRKSDAHFPIEDVVYGEIFIQSELLKNVNLVSLSFVDELLFSSDYYDLEWKIKREKYQDNHVNNHGEPDICNTDLTILKEDNSKLISLTPSEIKNEIELKNSIYTIIKEIGIEEFSVHNNIVSESLDQNRRNHDELHNLFNCKNLTVFFKNGFRLPPLTREHIDYFTMPINSRHNHPLFELSVRRSYMPLTHAMVVKSDEEIEEFLKLF